MLYCIRLPSDSELNIWSAAVFGLIVTLSFSLGVPSMAQGSDVMPIDALTAPNAFLYVAFISLIGLVLFKKMQSLGGRKFVNPAAAAKFLVLLPFIGSVLLVKDHFAPYDAATGTGLGVPSFGRSFRWRNCTSWKQWYGFVPYLSTKLLRQPNECRHN